ncbi:MAG: PAS/PAC sensor signal transduction histidine [Geobacteraceae bacterium]|nr:MAG: PAS/PAC sensor signal transduction histidine [Geobacteraceae bacterium]
MGNMENIRLMAPPSEAIPFTPTAAGVADSIVDNISAGIIYMDDLGILRFINSRAEELLQVSRNSVLGKRVDMLPLRTAVYKVVSENCRDFPVEMSFNGMVVMVKASEIRSHTGSVLGEVMELRDVTEEKKERRQREEFVAMMTHDLKSPLTVMMGYIEAIKNEMVGGVDESLHTCIHELDRSSFKLLAMIEDVLDAYRLEVGLLKINREYCDIKAVLNGCCRDMAREAQVRGINFTFSIADDIHPLKVDGKQIVRVFANLIGNALKFTPHRGNVSVVAEKQGGSVVVMVQDTGIGIPANDHARVFNKYYRSAGAGGFKGTGLGLTISKAIVDAHGGAIEVESSEGVGSRFTVDLPIVQAE